jgi:lysophospholipase L1-like esterase
MQDAVDASGPLRVPANPRIAVLGDSLASGLGVREHSYGRMVAKDLGAEAVLFKAKARRMVDECTEQIPRLEKFGPDLVLISTGETEGFVHPTRLIEQVLTKYGPKSWQGDVGLDARPYYSEDRRKRAKELLTSTVKVVFKNLVIRLGGGYSRMSHDQYRTELAQFLDAMEERGWPVVIAGIGYPNALLYPRSRRNLEVIDRIQRELVAGRRLARLLPLDGVIDFRTDTQSDGCHPSVAGHRKIADAHHALLEVVPRVAGLIPQQGSQVGLEVQGKVS